MVGSAVVALAAVNTQLAVLFTALCLFIQLVVPLWVLALQPYKYVVYEPYCAAE
jgi:hypothetical protein